MRIPTSHVPCRRPTPGAFVGPLVAVAAAGSASAAERGGWLAEVLPPGVFTPRVFGVDVWQGLALLALAVLATAVAWLATMVIVRSARTVMRRAAVDDAVAIAERSPLRLLIMVLVFAAGSRTLGLSPSGQAAAGGVTTVLGIAAMAWMALRAVDAFAATAERRFAARGHAVGISIVPLGRRSAQVFVVSVAAIATLQNFGFDVTGLIAGLGIGGLAIALAAQKTVENLFGGVTFIADQPVRAGDFCRFGDRVGTVEEIGLRSTRIRTLDRTVVSMPNGQFAALPLENFSARDRIWLQATLGLRYETTPDQLRHVLVELKRLLLSHPKIDPNPARVRLAAFAAYSLDLEIFAYVLTSDVNEFYAVREDLFLRIIDVVAASGTGFAFPSQTIYASTDGGLDPERRRAAEAEVRRWRDEHRLWLPDVPPARAAELHASLDWPPAGSPGRE